eukprot:scaffold89750_cov55-Phaeocystis_antarctica.AAC.1
MPLLRTLMMERPDLRHSIVSRAKVHYYSLLTTHYSLLTTHYSLLTTHYSLLTSHYSLLTTHYSLLTTHYSLLTTHHSPLPTSYSHLLLTTHKAWAETQSWSNAVRAWEDVFDQQLETLSKVDAPSQPQAEPQPQPEPNANPSH